MPASAQALLPPFEITTSVRSMGLEPISPPVRRGARYVLRAIDKRGAEVRVAADAINGRILFVRPVGVGERPVEGPVYADRAYPRIYPDETAPPRGSKQRQGRYDPPDNYQQPGNYVRPPARIPGEPSVIYANPQAANPQNANPRAPSTAKPAPAPKVAAKPPAQSAPATAPVEAAKTAPSSEITTGSTSAPPAAAKPPASQPARSQVAATPPAPEPAPAEAAKTEKPPAATTGSTSSPPAEKNPALTAPPVQAFD
jgi:hypothetical protein